LSKFELDMLRELGEEHVRGMLFRKVFERAEAYYRDQRVGNQRRIDGTLEAHVRGTELYAVHIEAIDGRLMVSCTCPFAQTAVCKHIGAVMLQWIRQPESFTVPAEGEERLPSARYAPGTFTVQIPFLPGGLRAGHELATAVPAAGAEGGQTESNLPTLLEQLTLANLREIARQRGWPIRGHTKADYVAALAPQLADPTDVARAVTSLSDDLRETLRAAYVAEDGHGITPVSLARVITALRGDQRPPLKAVEAAGRLTDLARWGLVIPWRSFSNGLCYLFPWEVQSNVPPLPGWCRQARQPPSANVLSRDRCHSVGLLYRMWESISQEQPALRPALEPLSERRFLTALQDWTYDPQEVHERLVKGRRRANQAVGTLSVPPLQPLLTDDGQSALAALTDGDTEEVEFVCRLLGELGLVSVEDGHLEGQRDAMAQFLRKRSVEQCAAVAQAYTSVLDWNELDMLLRAAPRLTLRRNMERFISYAYFRSELVRLRQMLLRFLATAGEEGWCALADVKAALRTMWPGFFSTPEAKGTKWLPEVLEMTWRQDQGESKADDVQDWRAAQSAFLQLMLQGPLYWLGFAELCMRDGELLAFRLHGLADVVWDRPFSIAHKEAQDSSVAVDEQGLTITVHPNAIPPQVHSLLGRMARLEQVRPGHFMYRLDVRTARASFERGKSLSGLLAEWNEVMPVAMPEAVHRTLTDWWNRYGQVRLYEGLALLELSDEIALRELEASTSLRQQIVARLSSRLVIVPDEAVDALVREFTVKGYTPKQVR
jgi:hypothetical protein